MERLLAASASSVPEGFRAAIREEAARSRKLAFQGTLDAFLWVGGSGRSVAAAVLERLRVGTEVRLHLDSELRSPEQFAALISTLGQVCPPGIKSIVTMGSELGPTTFGQVLRESGFEEIRRVDMTISREQALPAESPPPGLRGLSAHDENELTRLLDAAYLDNPIDRAIFAREPGLDDAKVVIADLLYGKVGEWLPSASFGVDISGRLGAATLAQRFHGFLISEVMVDPEFRRRGYAKSLLAHTIRALRNTGLDTIRLVVTRTNPRAMTLYHSLGFVERPETEGGLWLNLPMFPAAARQWREASQVD